MENKFNVGDLVKGKFINIPDQHGIITVVVIENATRSVRAIVKWCDGKSDILYFNGPSWRTTKVVARSQSQNKTT